MKVRLSDGTRLYIDVEGVELAVDGPGLAERPTLVLLHGGPGFDHTTFKPSFSALADVCQIVYVDHRGQGRSDTSSPDRWYLDQWADDVADLCDVLGIEHPIVLGNSFGGMVAMRYEVRHPGHARALVLSSTMARIVTGPMIAMFGRLGGPDSERAAAAFWDAPDAEAIEAAMADYQTHCGGLYNVSPGNLFDNRAIRKPAVSRHFFSDEARRMNQLPTLGAITCPTLCLAGTVDPVCTLEAMTELADAIPGAQLDVYDNCGHGVFRDAPDRAFAALRTFITSLA